MCVYQAVNPAFLPFEPSRESGDDEIVPSTAAAVLFEPSRDSVASGSVIDGGGDPPILHAQSSIDACAELDGTRATKPRHASSDYSIRISTEAPLLVGDSLTNANTTAPNLLRIPAASVDSGNGTPRTMELSHLSTIPDATPPQVRPRSYVNQNVEASPDNPTAAEGVQRMKQDLSRGHSSAPPPISAPRVPRRQESKPPSLSNDAIDRGDILRKALDDDRLGESGEHVEWEEEVMTESIRLTSSAHSAVVDDVPVIDFPTQYVQPPPSPQIAQTSRP